MKLLYLLAVLGCSAALPSPPLAWEDIKGENVYMKPINNYTENVHLGGRIIGGTEVTPNSVGYQVGIFINGRSFCGGSLISRNFVLSAAHCTDSASFVELYLGAHNVQVNEATQMRITSTNIINHPQFTWSTLRNDVSLVRIPTAITTNSNIQIIPLAPATAGTYAGASSLLTGWGRISESSQVISSVLKGVVLNIITNALCANAYGTDVIFDTTICTSGVGTVGACQGDSGGPLVVDKVQVGVTSFVSARGCESDLPTGYARVSGFKNWIVQNSDVTS